MLLKDLLAELVLLGLSGAIIPLALLQVTMRLTSVQPLANTLSFVLGFNAFRAALGIIAVSFFPGWVAAGGYPTRDTHLFVVIAGGVLLWLAYANLRSPLRVREVFGKLWEAARTATPRQSFVQGCAEAVLNASSLIIFFAGVAEIVNARPGPVRSVGALLVLLLAMSSAMLALVAVYSATPKRGAPLIQAFSDWMLGHSRAFSVMLFGLVGLHLLIKGMQRLLG